MSLRHRFYRSTLPFFHLLSLAINYSYVNFISEQTGGDYLFQRKEKQNVGVGRKNKRKNEKKETNSRSTRRTSTTTCGTWSSRGTYDVPGGNTSLISLSTLNEYLSGSSLISPGSSCSERAEFQFVNEVVDKWPNRHWRSTAVERARRSFKVCCGYV